MTDIHPFQQKEESTNDRELEGGMDELTHGNMDDCMSFTSYSSTQNPNEEEEEGDRLIRRRRRSDVEGEDLAESSAARMRHSRILSQWAAQAQEMITTIERRNRESELVDLADLHPVSMLDSSFLRESQSLTSRRQGAGERPSTQASSILRMWRELEDEHLLSRARGRARDRLRQQRSGRSNTNISSTNVSESQGSDHQPGFGTASESENEYAAWSHEQMGTQNEQEDSVSLSREQSPDPGEVERERVRQIAREWMESGMSDHSSIATQRNSTTRAEWLGETERERVRIVRQWVQMTSQQRGAPLERMEDQTFPTFLADSPSSHDRLHGRQVLVNILGRAAREREVELQGLSEHRAVSDFAHRNRIQSLLRGRFLRNERPVEDVRPPSSAANELVQLRNRHTVSGLREGFRNRLENIVRGQASSLSDTATNDNINHSMDDESPINTSETNQSLIGGHSQPLHQESDIHHLPDEAGRPESTTAVESTNWQENNIQGGSWHEQISEEERRDWQQATYNPLDGWRDSNTVDMDTNSQEHSDNDWREEAATNANEEGNLQDTQGAWHEDGSREAAGDWSERPSNHQRTQRTAPLGRFNRFHPPDDDNIYSVELRELLSRRSVSNLLRSGFRESLDQLIQSYVERHGHSQTDWDLHRNLPTPASVGQVQEQQRVTRTEVQNHGVTRPTAGLSSPPVPPPQPTWNRNPPPQHTWSRNVNHFGWSRHTTRRSDTEWELMTDMKADMTRLQQSMNHMQSMVEACIDMQFELQRSVRQEVSAALNRSVGEKGSHAETSEDGSKWSLVRKGTCCICCDSHIDSLLYRCGHMCTCYKCANELVRGGGKCPLCRAPIAEVIRAYSLV